MVSWWFRNSLRGMWVAARARLWAHVWVYSGGGGKEGIGWSSCLAVTKRGCLRGWSSLSSVVVVVAPKVQSSVDFQGKSQKATTADCAAGVETASSLSPPIHLCVCWSFHDNHYSFSQQTHCIECVFIVCLFVFSMLGPRNQCEQCDYCASSTRLPFGFQHQSCCSTGKNPRP